MLTTLSRVRSAFEEAVERLTSGEEYADFFGTSINMCTADALQQHILTAPSLEGDTNCYVLMVEDHRPDVRALTRTMRHAELGRSGLRDVLMDMVSTEPLRGRMQHVVMLDDYSFFDSSFRDTIQVCRELLAFPINQVLKSFWPSWPIYRNYHHRFELWGNTCRYVAGDMSYLYIPAVKFWTLVSRRLYTIRQPCWRRGRWKSLT